ncbi:MAG: SIMPL domain-containing protein [Candidatus Rokuibacteriota bacterium]|nr:MAG: SIMPL domain-containing protein [Candidatus Rokubacteria bacterium]
MTVLRKASVALLLLAALPGGCVRVRVTPEYEALDVVSVNGVGKVSASRRMTEVLARVKALGIPDQDITTVAYSVDPIVAPRRTDEEASRIVAYRVVNVVRLRIRDLTAGGPVVDGAVAAGANTISALQFTVNDPAHAESEARALAVRAAATKAKEIAVAAGARLGDLLSVTEGVGPRPIVAQAAAVMAARPSGPGPVEAGQLEIVVNVHARYRIVPR